MSHLVAVGAIIRSRPSSSVARGHLVAPRVGVAVPVGALVLASLAEDGEALGQVVVSRIGLRVELRGLQDVVVDLHF